MIKKLGNLLFKNFWWKLISLLMATVLWFISMNINNPMTSEQFFVSLEIRGEENITKNNYIILNKTELLGSRRIALRVQGTKQYMNLLSRDQSGLKAYIDLRPVDISQTSQTGVPMPVSVRCEVPTVNGSSEYEILNFNPMSIDVVLDRLVSKPVPITVERMRSPTEGYVAMDAIVTPDTVVINGAKSLVDTIASVGVSVNLENATHSVDIKGEKLIVYDYAGKDITSQLSLSVEEVNISVPVLKYAKIPIAAPTFSNATEEGYNLLPPVNWSPKYVEVVGDEESIDATKEIKLDTIDLTGRTTSEKITFDLRDYLEGTNLSIRNGTPSTVSVDIVIEKEIEVEMEIPLTDLRYKGMTSSFELPPGTVTLKLRGNESRAAELSPEHIQGSIDLTGLEPGTHDVPVEFDLPDGIVQVEPDITVEVRIFDESEDQEGTEPVENAQEETEDADVYIEN